MLLRFTKYFLVVAGICLAVASGSSVASAQAADSGDSQPSPNMCHVAPRVKAFLVCTYGSDQPTYRVALTGDSHAMQYQMPVLELANKYGWSVTFVLKSACPVVDPLLYPNNMSNKQTCSWWNDKREKYFKKQEPFDLVINSNSTYITHYAKNIGEAFASTVKKITDRKTQFLLIRDNPKGIPGVSACSLNSAKVLRGRCDNKKTSAMYLSDPLPVAVAKNQQVVVADLTSFYCDKSKCYANRFGSNVYRDDGHVSLHWALNLLSGIDDAVPENLKHPRL